MSALPFEHQDHAYMEERLGPDDLLQQLADSPKEIVIRVLLDGMRFIHRTSRQQRVVLDKCFEVKHDTLPAQKKICKNIFPIMTNGTEFDVEDVEDVPGAIFCDMGRNHDAFAALKKLSFEKQKILDTKNEQGQSRNVKQDTQVANEKIILNPDVGQAQTSIPTKWFLEIMNNNFQKYKEANIAEKKDIANDILAKVKERGYSFYRYNRDIDKLVAVENSGRRYIGHIRQMFVRMA